jgi:serine/threonine-protein kinase HipA
LFAFFQGLLAEGINKDIQCRLLKIDENDDFLRLLQTAGNDTIGAVTVKAM